eukprot:TRINITY_DN22501_c0_g1_i2.p1 TRINITY_DN22501_c0_g1~~TRINITY_DN22501_c0_g1_i2.p1  ORF type:complete len:413 (-),score=107.49 TRINITY_DN22501_c0_g1_i2:8-1246(-)
MSLSEAAPHLQWTAEALATSTPSRKCGIPEKVEQKERFFACDYARNLIRQLYSDKKSESESTEPQIFACYYIQLFFMFRSLQDEDWKIVAVGSAFLACKVVDMPRRMRALLRAWNQHRVANGEPELGEEEQKKMTDRILKIEFLLLRILRFDFRRQTPINELESLARSLLVVLSNNETFKAACKGKPAVQEASNLQQEILTTAERFTMDSFMGIAPLLAKPKVLAAGAIVLTTKYCRREMQLPELIKLMNELDDGLQADEVKRVIEEIMNVFRTKAVAEKEKQKAAAPAAATSAAVPGPAKAPAVTVAAPAAAPSTAAQKTVQTAAPAVSAVADRQTGESAASKPAAATCSTSVVAAAPAATVGAGGPATPSSAPPTLPASGMAIASEPHEPGQPDVTPNRVSRRSHPYSQT